ncbi:MAG: hypothetical protein ACTTJK_04750 [Phocaeicola sp.]|uniref:hypothetical protein n=1 Tax=Phocaeicola sp. TaxID=2773926 RepID=UPI003FA17E0D
METIFDHNVTDEELTRFGGRESFEWCKEHNIDLFENPDDANYAIGLLYSGRGDKEKANYYWSKIKDKDVLGALVQDF